MPATRDEDIAYCVHFVKEHANDLYLADLLLPKHFRDDIFVLHAFHAEIVSIGWRTQEPTMGEIRLQWWAEVIEGERGGEAQGHPIARLLLDVIERHNLPRPAFLRKLEAHQFDLYNDPMGDRTMLEGYLGETHSSLFQLSGIIAGESDLKNLASASGHAGVATGIVWILRNMPQHRQLQKVYVPNDLLEAVGLNAQSFLEDVPSQSHEQVMLTLIDLAGEHGLKLKNTSENVLSSSEQVFNQIKIFQVYLDKIKKSPLKSMTTMISVSQFRRQLRLLMY